MNSPNHGTPVTVALVGCGAIAEQYYAPALAEAGRHTPLAVVAVFDPSPARVAALKRWFPDAAAFSEFEELHAVRPDLAIVASPPRFHAEQVNALLAAGAHVLCEKPMAGTVEQAESMVGMAHAANRLLAVGLFRRFFPALQTIKALVSNQTLGAPRLFHFSEGGPFNWPAASASFFQKGQSPGGVLADLGIHVLDLVHWWFGRPTELACADDAMGNLEANSEVTLKFAGGLAGVVRVSRDTPMHNVFTIQFENGLVRWKVGDANHLDVQFPGAPGELRSELWEAVPEKHDAFRRAPTYHQSFVKQLLNVVAAARGEEPLRVSGEEALHSLRLVENCYRCRTLLPMPWLTPRELEPARALNLTR